MLKPSLAAAMPILLLSLFIIVNVAIWWAGPWLDIKGNLPLDSMMERAIASSLFSLSTLALWGVWQWRKLQGFQAERKYEERLRQDPIKAYEDRQEVELNQIMVSMKENLPQRDYLYALPWYLVLGLENAGKTSLINRSGQNYVFSSVMRASGQKSENPYSFDWWIGDESVMIDPDGELLTQGNYANYDHEHISRGGENDGAMERRLWMHFVHWLEKTRNRRPLNGIVLTIDVSRLATATATERKAYANLLRARLRELMETLSTRLPVYITLTKLDLLQGFEPFFKHYSRRQREEVLGFTFSLDSVEDLDHWLKEFSAEYSDFIARINDVLPHSVSGPMSLEDRNAIYSFTRQVSGLKEILANFLSEALASDQFSTSALVRGVYFTSVYQQGVPTNAFDDAASRRYGLDHAINKAQHAKNSTVYFTQKLFNNVIYPEAGLASDNVRVTRHNRRVMGLTMIACSIVTVLFVGTWHRYYLNNVQQSDAVLAKVNEYKSELSSTLNSTSQQDILEPLNKIREATLEFGFFREKPKYISDFGLYQGHTIGPMVEETYLNLLENRFLPLLMADLVVQLNQARTDEEKLAVLRVYRMMVDKSGRYQNYVLDYFVQYWQREFDGQRDIQVALQGHLEYAMKHTDLTADRANGNADAERVMKPYDKVIASVQTELSAIPNDQRVYRNLKLNSQMSLGPAINLRNLVGPVFDMVFEEQVINRSEIYIPQMLTKKGFEDYFMPQSESISELALIDSWVLGLSNSAQFSEADKVALREKVRKLYVADYTNTWRLALNEINVKYFSDINHAASVLENLTGNIEPIQRLLRVLESNTKMYTNVPEDKAAQEALLHSSKYNVASQIDTPFSELNDMLSPVGEKPAYINEVLAAVEGLHSYVKAIQEAPDVGMAALDATKARVKLVNADPIYTVRRVASGLPKPLNIMLEKLADESWYVVKQEAIRHLEVRWYNDVYKTFQSKLAGRYPFNPTSRKDSSFVDFEAFFAPDGTLDNFYNSQLKMFVEENVALSDENSNGNSVISREVLGQLKQAKRIQQAFFNRKGVLDVSFSVEPLLLTSDKRRSVLNVDGQYLAYNHGPRDTVEFIWPNTFRKSAVSKVTLVPAKNNMSPRSINIRGPWAFFRLLEQGDVVGASATSVDFKFSVDGGQMIYRLNSEADINPFTERLFKSFKLSKTLY